MSGNYIISHAKPRSSQKSRVLRKSSIFNRPPVVNGRKLHRGEIVELTPEQFERSKEHLLRLASLGHIHIVEPDKTDLTEAEITTMTEELALEHHHFIVEITELMRTAKTPEELPPVMDEVRRRILASRFDSMKENLEGAIESYIKGRMSEFEAQKASLTETNAPDALMAALQDTPPATVEQAAEQMQTGDSTVDNTSVGGQSAPTEVSPEAPVAAPPVMESASVPSQQEQQETPPPAPETLEVQSTPSADTVPSEEAPKKRSRASRKE